MREWILEQVSKESERTRRKLMLAEYLQHLILQTIYRGGYFKYLIFTGGTALRLLYRTGRFSEDLDFSLNTAQRGFKIKRMIEYLQRISSQLSCGFESGLKDKKTILAADLKFPMILKESGISRLADEKLTIKLEIDTNPPRGGKAEIVLVASPINYTVAAYDLPSLFATKLHALMYRGFVKGRDYYDLVWFLGKIIHPNFTLLNNAIRQTHPGKKTVTEVNFKDTVIRFLDSIDFAKVRKDVERFLMEPAESSLLTLESVKSLLRNY